MRERALSFLFPPELFMFELFSIFAQMDGKTKSKKNLALTLLFIMLMINCVSINLIHQKGIILTYEYCVFSEPCEHSYANCFEDDILFHEATRRPCNLEILRDPLLFTNPDFSGSFDPKVWQPPKNS
jgi:hypothetical protein